MAAIIFANNAESVRKAGANASAVSILDTYTDAWGHQAESFVNAATRFNWSDKYGALNEDVKFLLEDAATDLVAIRIIAYDMSGYSTRNEAESMISVLRDSALRSISVLREIKSQTFVIGA